MHCPSMMNMCFLWQNFNIYNIRPKVKIWPEQMDFNFQIQVVKINVEIW